MAKRSKGISPLVAVIMLIAFTMIVAGILAGWATRFATEQRSMLEKCVRANVVIKKATYAAGDINLMLYNPGTVPLVNFQVQVTYDEDGPPMPSAWTITDTLAANSFETFSHNLSNTSVELIEVRSAECQGAYDMVRSYDITGL
jgi:flagellin-like protein